MKTNINNENNTAIDADNNVTPATPLISTDEFRQGVAHGITQARQAYALAEQQAAIDRDERAAGNRIFCGGVVSCMVGVMTTEMALPADWAKEHEDAAIFLGIMGGIGGVMLYCGLYSAWTQRAQLIESMRYSFTSGVKSIQHIIGYGQNPTKTKQTNPEDGVVTTPSTEIRCAN